VNRATPNCQQPQAVDGDKSSTIPAASTLVTVVSLHPSSYSHWQGSKFAIRDEFNAHQHAYVFFTTTPTFYSSQHKISC